VRLWLPQWFRLLQSPMPLWGLHQDPMPFGSFHAARHTAHTAHALKHARVVQQRETSQCSVMPSTRTFELMLGQGGRAGSRRAPLS
jgi:hypothetical protein